MIEKLYNLKKLQTDQKVLQKQQVLAKIQDIDEQIQMLKNQRYSTSVSHGGQIVDFSLVQIHYNNIQANVEILQAQKQNLKDQLRQIDMQIMLLQKDSEKYDYLKNEIKKQKYKQMLKKEEIDTNEYMQSKWVNQR